MNSQCELETLSGDGSNAPSKKQKISVNYRQWSVDAETCTDSITHYTIKVYYGDPEDKLPYWMKKLNKADIIDQMVTYEGFRREECVGTKDQLLQKLQRCRPFVTFKIDGREGIQRVLSTALRQFGWSCDHMFQATMPRRGTSTVGPRTYQDILSPYKPNVLFPSRYHIKKRINRDFAHLLQWQRDEMFEDIMELSINLSDIAPRRSFTGCAFEVQTMVEPHRFEPQTIFLSLNDLALQRGDRIRYKYDYDFGDPSIFIAEILDCDVNQPLLPLIHGDDEGLSVRAMVVEESTIKIQPQYQGDDDYNDSDYLLVRVN